MKKFTLENIDIMKLEGITIYMDNDTAGINAGNELFRSLTFYKRLTKNTNFISKLPDIEEEEILTII